MSLPRHLKEFTILEEFSENDLRLLATFIEEVEYKDGQVIIDQKVGSTALFFILTGSVRVQREFPGKTSVLMELSEHEVFGEVAFADQGERTANVYSIGNTEIGVFQFEHFEIIKKQDAAFGMKLLMTLLKQLAKKFRAVNKSFDNLFKSLITGGK